MVLADAQLDTGESLSLEKAAQFLSDTLTTARHEIIVDTAEAVWIR